jgi:FKBP-type peptidyl-prolyl cis-trans isomerase FklB
MKKIVLIGLFITLFVSGVQAQEPVSPLKLSAQLDSASYAIGASIAFDLKSRGLSALNYTALMQAMQDVFAGKNPQISMQDGQQAIMAYFTELKKKQEEPLITAAANFLAENKKKKGVITLTSGLQYEILTAAKGAKPKATDSVTVHYKGTLSNGKQFESSYERNQPANLSLTQVIQGWVEGMQLMSVGAKYRFYIPYQLAWGPTGAGQDIPPYSVVIFEIELLKIGQ